MTRRPTRTTTICTPPFLHREQAETCAAAGMHLVVATGGVCDAGGHDHAMPSRSRPATWPHGGGRRPRPPPTRYTGATTSRPTKTIFGGAMTTAPPHPLRFGIQLQGQRTTWSDYLAAAHLVEALGFDSLWVFDHLLPFSGPDDGPAFETLTTLGALAVATTRVRLGTLVNGVLYRDPVTLAKASALVDVISGGRLEFTLGA